MQLGMPAMGGGPGENCVEVRSRLLSRAAREGLGRDICCLLCKGRLEDNPESIPIDIFEEEFHLIDPGFISLMDVKSHPIK